MTLPAWIFDDPCWFNLAVHAFNAAFAAGCMVALLLLADRYGREP